MNYFEMCGDELKNEEAQGRKPFWDDQNSWAKTFQGFGRAKTKEAEKAINELDFILSQALDVDYERFWDCVLKKKDYQEKNPRKYHLK